MIVLGRALVPPFGTFWEQYRSEIPVPVEQIEEGHSVVFGDQGFDLTSPEKPMWASLPDDDLAYHVAHELTHIVQRERGYPKTARGRQYPPDSAEARIGADLEEMILHPPLEELLHGLGFRNDFIRGRMLNGALNGLSSSPVPEYGTPWFFTWAFRYCEMELELPRADWLRLKEVYRTRSPEICALGEELVAIMREAGWGTREQALDAMVRVRDALGLKVNEIVLVVDQVTGDIL